MNKSDTQSSKSPNSEQNSGGRAVIVWSTVTVVAVVILTMVLWKYALPPLQPGAATQTQTTTTAADLAAIRKIEDSLLTTYEWLNRDSGTVRIPIERAIELIARDATAQTR